MPNDWNKAKRIFADAIKIAPAERLAFLDEVCQGDAEMRREVESLLDSLDDAGSFMQQPAAHEVADFIRQNKSLEAGKSFGHYEIVRQIGAGGMGEVYLAKDTRLDRLVALKILNENFSRHEINRSRFIQEAKVASSLNHPNILIIHEINEENSLHYIVSEYIEGKTLREIINASSLNLNDILDISIQIANALAVAHEAHLVHRDIKPENIIIRPDGLVKILDFGLAKLVKLNQPITNLDNETAKKNETAKGIILGTVNYMSPEQAKGEKVDERTDIFSFGSVIYEMIVGKTPFGCESISETWTKLMHVEPFPIADYMPDVPEEMQKIISKTLEKNKDVRYQTARDLIVDLHALKRFVEPQTELQRIAPPNPQFNGETQFITSSINGELLSIAPNNLTENHSLIIGREPEIEEIKNLLRQNNVCLLTMTGIGGVGKTRLAQAVAREMLAEFPDGVFFIEFAAIRSEELVASTIAQSLGVKEAGGKPILEILKDYLKMKQILIVIDNFEQIIDAAPTIAELLSIAHKLKILITSRMLLHLSKEREFIVSPLAVPTEFLQISLEEFWKYEAIKLFMARAQNAKPSFSLTEENAPCIAEICLRLDGLPLAIELAAARIKILSPFAILAKLENSLKLLIGGARDLPTRQQTMRGAIEWSYELLNKAEKTLFCRLSVFIGGFTIDAAETVVNNSNPSLFSLDGEQNQTDGLDIDILEGITSLVDKNLLSSKEMRDGEPRFRMLEVVREYALESLEKSGEASMVLDSHAAYFLALGEEAEQYLTGEKAVEWLNHLEAEHDNLRAVLDWTFQHNAEKAAHLTAAIQYFWFLHGHLTEGQRYSEAALELSVNNSLVRWKLLNTAGRMARQKGDYHKAQEFYEKSLKIAGEIGEKRQIALSNWGIGATAYLLNNHPAAREFLEKSLVIGRELDDKKVLAVVVSALGELARTEENYAKAQPFYQEALTLSKQVGNKEGIAVNLNNLGAVAYYQEDFKATHSFYAEALATALELGHLVCISWSYDGFAALAVATKDLEKAAKLAGAADALRQSIGFELETTDRLFRNYYLSKLCLLMKDEEFISASAQGRKLKMEEIIALINL